MQSHAAARSRTMGNMRSPGQESAQGLTHRHPYHTPTPTSTRRLRSGPVLVLVLGFLLQATQLVPCAHAEEWGGYQASEKGSWSQWIVPSLKRVSIESLIHNSPDRGSFIPEEKCKGDTNENDYSKSDVPTNGDCVLDPGGGLSFKMVCEKKRNVGYITGYTVPNCIEGQEAFASSLTNAMFGDTITFAND